MCHNRKINRIIKILLLSLHGTLLLSLATSTALASVHNAVSIVSMESLQESSFTYRLRLQLDNRQETLVLNRSDAFKNIELLHIGDHRDNRIEQDRVGQDRVAQPTTLEDIAIYQGQIEDVPDSWARVVIQDDDVSGIIDTGSERIHLNNFVAADSVRQIRSRLNHKVDKTLMAPADRWLAALRESRDVIEIDIGNGFFNKPDKVTKVASIAIVIDGEYDEAIGGRGLAQAISTINAVDGIYREEFGLALKVETAIIVTDSETLSLGDISLEDNLSRFRDYRLVADQLSPDLALVHLFTGVATADPSVGLAYIDTVCKTNGYDVSLSLPFRYPILLTAHEIGHNLGALHDDETNLCSAIGDRLMFSHINDESTRAFSSCSIDAISKRLEQSTCHADAIDMELALARQNDSGVIALITNTDGARAFPQADLFLEMENATIAAAPASCEVITDTTVRCAVPRTFAEESQSFPFDLRIDQSETVTVNARLQADGFVDVHNLNNSAEIVFPQVVVTTQNDTNNGSDENPETADAADGDAGGNAGSQTSGGGLLGLTELILFLVMSGAYRTGRQRSATRKLLT